MSVAETESQCSCSDNLFKELEQFINKLKKDKKGNLKDRALLIEVLHKAQGLFGYLPPKVQTFIADKLDVSPAKVFGVVTFYSYFTMEPKGDHVINVCMGTACYVRGAENVLKEFENKLKIKNGQTTEDGKFTLSSLRCVGACGLAPVVIIDDEVYGKLTPDMVDGLIKKFN